MSKSDHQKVMEAVEDRFYEVSLFSNASDICDWSGLTRATVDNIIDDLEGDSLFRVYEGDGNPTVYVTKQMMNSLTSAVGEPDWIQDYEFSEKARLREEVKEANESITEYQKLERLLFGGGTPLEESVEHGLKELGWNPQPTDEDEDLLLEVDGHHFVIEIKGVSGQVKKKHITQLSGWLDKKIDEGIKASQLTGVLIHNHEKNTDPEDRDSPLTKHAKQFLELRSSTDVSTVELFRIIKSMRENDKTQAEAQSEFQELLQ